MVLTHGDDFAAHMSHRTTGRTSEADIVEYERRGQPKPSDETLRVILLAMVPKNLEEYLNASAFFLDQRGLHDPTLN